MGLERKWESERGGWSVDIIVYLTCFLCNWDL